MNFKTTREAEEFMSKVPVGETVWFMHFNEPRHGKVVRVTYIRSIIYGSLTIDVDVVVRHGEREDKIRDVYTTKEALCMAVFSPEITCK